MIKKKRQQHNTAGFRTSSLPLVARPRCALLLSVVGAHNKGYTVRGSARPSPKFCSVSLRKTSYIPNVSTKKNKNETSRIHIQE